MHCLTRMDSVPVTGFQRRHRCSGDLCGIIFFRRSVILSGSSGAGGLRKLPAGCGAALLFLPSLNGSFLQGASFIDGNRIVVGLSARGKDADKIWFSLFHEPGHIVQVHADQPDRTSSKDEKAADQWAGEEMIPWEDFESFRRGIFAKHTSVCRSDGNRTGNCRKQNAVRRNDQIQQDESSERKP